MLELAFLTIPEVIWIFIPPCSYIVCRKICGMFAVLIESFFSIVLLKLLLIVGLLHFAKTHFEEYYS